MKVISGVYSGVSTIELDTLAAETSASMTTKHPDYATLAARIAISNLHKQTKKLFSAVMEDLYGYVNKKNKKHSPMISAKTRDIIRANSEVRRSSYYIYVCYCSCSLVQRLNSAIIYDRDFSYTYFGFKVCVTVSGVMWEGWMSDVGCCSLYLLKRALVQF